MPVQQWVIGEEVTEAGAVRRQVVAHAAEHGVTGAVLRNLALAASELVANVIRQDGAERDATISVDVRHDRITVIVRGPCAGLAPQLDDRAGHRAMIVVAAVADDVRVAHTEGGGREVSMTLLRDVGAPSSPAR